MVEGGRSARGTSSASLGNHLPGPQTEQGLSRPLASLSPSTWRPHTGQALLSWGGAESRAWGLAGLISAPPQTM